MNDTTIHNGLEGIIAAETSLSMVDGMAGELVIAPATQPLSVTKFIL